MNVRESVVGDSIVGKEGVVIFTNIQKLCYSDTEFNNNVIVKKYENVFKYIY